ncbi:MAG: sporulation protein YqfD [Clostridiales bacterium]|nr:sporulation protein YqfD [Clostridiales bacterium]
MEINGMRLAVTGFNQARLFSELAAAGVRLSRVCKKSPSKAEFTIRKKDGAKAFAILEKMCYNYSVTAIRGFCALPRFCALRSGLIAGLALFSCLFALSRGLIWRVSVGGNEKVDSLVIQRVLAEHGAVRGKSAKNVDADGLRNALNSIDGIIESSVRLSGPAVKIEVVEAADYVPPAKPETRGVVSLYDATVTRVAARSGTAAVKRGGRVKRGDVLIGAYRFDQSGNKLPSAAAGEVYGRTVFQKTVTFGAVEYQSVRTGRTLTATAFKFWGTGAGVSAEHGFLRYETETTESYAFDGLFVPLKVVRTVYYETELRGVEVDPDEKAERLAAEFAAELAVLAGAAQTETTKLLKQAGDNLYSLTVFVEAEILISGGG